MYLQRSYVIELYAFVETSCDNDLNLSRLRKVRIKDYYLISPLA